ncbi:MAG: hypothetical protein ONA90_01660 [candidate division KSB1 bacterium]|nr:hypothetical protein [candidate division KSB1 bacterium]
MKKFSILLLLVSGLGMVASPLSLNAQVSTQFDTARMQRDLDIMEGILDQLALGTPKSFLRWGSDGTRGIYLPNYGVVFLVPLKHTHLSVSRPNPTESRVTREVHEEVTEAHKKTPHVKSVRRQSSSTYYSSTTQHFKEPVLEFFAKYADAIGQLEESERIAVYLTGRSNIFVTVGEGPDISTLSTAMASDQGKLAVARKADIVALRTGRLNEENFQNRVVWRDVAREEGKSEIEIMARIIDAYLQPRAATPTFYGQESRGLYLDGYGAVFFSQATFGRSFVFQFFDQPGGRETEESIQRHLIELESASQRRRENWHNEYKKFKQQLGELIADYGHTLRQLKPQDYIAICAELYNPPEEGPNHLVCSIKKQHVDAFNARRISREQLIKLISYMEY